MGQTPAETAREIDETRDRLTIKLQELESRLPPPTWSKRIAGIVLGGGVLGAVVLFLMRRRRGDTGGKRLRSIDRRLSRIEQRLDEVADAI